jgi:hypothetical protein
MAALPMYISRLRGDMLEAVRKYRQFDEEWNRLNDAFKDKIQEENIIRRRAGRPLHTPLSIAKQKNEWLAQKDAMAAATWWRDKANTMATVIQTELMCMEEERRNP